MPKITKTKRNKHKINDFNPILVYFIYALRGFIICYSLLLILSAFILKGENITVFHIVAAFASVFIGGLSSGYSSAKVLNGRGFVNGLLASVFYLILIVISFAALLRFNIGLFIILTVFCGIIGCVIGGMTGVNSK